jgi:HSP20 family molecular chaperone IbpA
MLSFYQKLAGKLNETAPNAAAAPVVNKVSPAAPVNAPTNKDEPVDATKEALPDGADPIDVDLFQSEGRMVLFCMMSGVLLDECELNIDEESNTLVIHATQKRPELPGAKVKKEDVPPEKGRYVKQEVKWRTLYRKVYLPAPFDSSAAEAYVEKGVLVVLLPSKQPGTGKKLTIREISDDKHSE